MFRSLGSALATGVLLLLSPGGVPASPAATRIVVGYTAEGYSGATELERELGAEVIGRIGALRADVLRLDGGEPDGALALLRSDPRVRYAELDGIVRASRVPNDEFLPTQWSVTKTHAEQAWDLSTGSSQVVVGILDTGIDPGQPDLRGKLVAGYDYVNNDQDPSDDTGHGTAVASGRVDAYATLRTLAPGSAPTEIPAPSQAQPRGGASGTGTSAGARRTKVVTGTLRRGKNASVVIVTGAGVLRATVKARTGRPTIRLRLVAAGRVAVSARGAGRASLRAQVRARTYRLVVSTTSRRPVAFALTVSYPAAGA